MNLVLSPQGRMHQLSQSAAAEGLEDWKPLVLGHNRRLKKPMSEKDGDSSSSRVWAHQQEAKVDKQGRFPSEFCVCRSMSEGAPTQGEGNLSMNPS